ncbi:MAG: ATP-binding protein [Nannocystaceae bacterium]|nr:PAS domain S-box protein [Myxococcales bacterium]
MPPQGSEVDGHGRTIGELSRELNDLQYEYGVLQDMLVEAWIDAGRHGAGEAELRMIVESLPVPVLISRRADGRILFAGGKILPVLGIEASALVGRASSTLYAKRPSIDDALAELDAHGVVHGHELRMRRADGSLFWIAVSLRAVEFRGEEAVLCALVDITERIEMAERLERARQEAEAASVAKSTFLAHMSHELRNPLNAIIGYAEMLVERSDEIDDEEFSEDARRILSVARMQLSIINDSLDLARIEAGRMRLVCERFRVAELVREVVTAARPLVQRNANLFEVSITSGLADASGDPARIRQILLNLLGNAAKFTSEGSVTLATRRCVVDGVATLEFQVRDTGIGMSEEDIAGLFKPFWQAQTPGRHDLTGSGLGMAISRQLARLMGGDIDVTSALEQGSTFTLRLPVDPNFEVLDFAE